MCGAVKRRRGKERSRESGEEALRGEVAGVAGNRGVSPRILPTRPGATSSTVARDGESGLKFPGEASRAKGIGA